MKGHPVRIAVSGSHMVGKSMLAEALAVALPRYELIPEPYYLLAEEGHLFADMPAVDDFELQLERSLRSVHESGADAVFDRCPLDILGYLVTHRDADVFQIGGWFPRIRSAVAMLDLVVFVPVEVPDRIDVPRSEINLRADVDAALWDIIVDDSYGFEAEAVTVSGTLEERMQRVMTNVR